MIDNKKIMADLDRVGALIEGAKKSKVSLTASQVEDCRKVLKSATAALFRMRFSNFKEAKSIQVKRAALQKSISESLISKEDGQKEASAVSKTSVANRIRMKKIQSALESIRKLVAEINTLAASPRLEQLEKGHESSADIKPPQKASASVNAALLARRKEAFRKFVAARRAKTASGEAVVSHQDEKDPKGNTAELDHKDHMTGAPSKDFAPVITAAKKVAADGTVTSFQDEKDPKGNTAELSHKEHMQGAASPDFAQVITGMKVRGRRMYLAASSMLKKADVEKDAAKKAELMRRAGILEKMGDHLAAKVTASLAKTAAATPMTPEKKAADQTKEATTITYAANDQVLLPDGVVGKVSTINGEKMTVSVAGVDREVLTSTVKKITSGKEEKKAGTDPVVAPAAPASDAVPATSAAPAASVAPKEGLAARIQKAVSVMRTGGKKTAAPEDAPVAKAPDAPKAQDAPKAMPVAGEGSPVSSVEAKTINFVDGVGWTVQVSANEVKSFGDDKAAAESFVKASGLNKTAKDMMLDSANPKAPASQEGIQSKLKGLDTSGKDYGSTKGEQKVNEQFSMVKKSTALTKDSPVDSATTTAPEQVVNQNKLKGLDQQGKDYGTTTGEQKVDPQFSAIARKNQILASTLSEQKMRLSVVESKLLVDRAVKVGALVEGQRSDQETVLAELYRNSPAEFKAYGRLITNLEANSGKKDIATRTVDRVKSAMERKGSLVVEASEGTSRSLDTGNFFDD